VLPLPIVELLLHSDYPKRPFKNLEVVGDVKANDGSASIDVEPQLPGSLTEALACSILAANSTKHLENELPPVKE